MSLICLLIIIYPRCVKIRRRRRRMRSSSASQKDYRLVSVNVVASEETWRRRSLSHLWELHWSAPSRSVRRISSPDSLEYSWRRLAPISFARPAMPSASAALVACCLIRPTPVHVPIVMSLCASKSSNKSPSLWHFILWCVRVQHN